MFLLYYGRLYKHGYYIYIDYKINIISIRRINLLMKTSIRFREDFSCGKLDIDENTCKPFV